MQPLQSRDEEERFDRRDLVEPDHLEARMERTWQRMDTPRRGSTSWKLPMASGLAAAVCAACVVWLMQPQPAAWAGTSLRSGERASHVELADGSTIDAAPHTHLQLRASGKREKRFALRQGSANFHVAKNPARDFIVEAGGATVRVIGTRFTVIREHDAGREHIEVRVQEGHVEVTAAGQERHLYAGDRWSVTEEHTPAPTVEQLTDEASDEAASRKRRRKRRRRATTPKQPDAAEWFERATSQRRAGDLKGAADAYQQLLKHHPQDSRGPLAAFELGRLQMDQLGAPRAAIRSLRTALRKSPSSPFREDAMARLVHAHDAVGDASGCRTARAAYLARYPAGRYAKAVEARCAD